MNGLYIFFSGPTQSVDRRIEDKKTEYLKIVNQIKGKVRDEKISYINKLKNDNDAIDSIEDDLYEKKIDKTITNKEYIKRINELENKKTDEYLLKTVLNQKSSALKNPDRIYIVYQNGWVNFFEKIRIDWLLLLLVVGFFSYVFTNEYETEMYILNYISCESYKKIFFSKTLLVMMLSSIASLLLNFEILLYSGLKYGLNGINYPIQSISVLRASKWNISILQGVCIYFLIGVVASIYISGMVVFFSVLLKKEVNTIITLLGIIVLPLFLVSDKMILKLNMPLAYIKKEIIMLGIYNEKTGNIDYLNGIHLIEKLVVAILISIILVIIAYIVHNRLFGRILNKRVKALLLCLVAICITGCDNNKKDTKAIYNAYATNLVTDGKYFVEKLNNDIVVNDGKDSFNLFREPFVKTDNVIVCGIFNDKVLCIENEDDKTFLKSVDILSGKTDMIYNEYYNDIPGYNYLDIYKSDNRSYDREHNEEKVIDNAFIVDGKIFIICNSVLYQLDGRHKKKIIDNLMDSMVYIENNNLFYINDKRVLQHYNFLTKKREILFCDIMLNSLRLDEDGLWAVDSENNLCLLDYKKKIVRRVCGHINDVYYTDEKYVYSVNDNNNIAVVEKNSGKMVCEYGAVDNITSLVAINKKIYAVNNINGKDELKVFENHK